MHSSLDVVDALISRFEAENGFFHIPFNATTSTANNTDGRIETGTYRTYINYTHSYPFEMEKNFDVRESIRFAVDNRWVVNLIVIGYLVTIFGIQRLMRDRAPLNMRVPMFLWNCALAAFSIMGTLRTLPEYFYLGQKYGIHFTMCCSGLPFLDNRIGGFWTWMFTLSKVPELGDTVFIVLRKQPLIFLHWYHHVTVLMYSWYSYSEYIATARWFIAMNYLVHSFMYSYYALKALKFRVPRKLAMCITAAQLAQMVMGTVVNVWAYQVKQSGSECHVSWDNIKVSLLMYTSYFVLFAHFFCRAYIGGSSRSAKKKVE